jgi:hypothetical protein
MTSVMELDSCETAGNPENVRQPLYGLHLQVDLPRLIRLLFCIIATLLITGTAANAITHQVAPSPEHKLAKLMNRFDIGFEPSIPNWYSSCALLACSILLAVTALAKKRQADPFWKQWLLLALLFVGLSMDEGVRFHEMIHTAIASQIETHGLLYFPWVVPALIFVAIVGCYYISFLKHIDRRTAVLFVVSASIYVMGAVGMDIVGGLIVERSGMESIGHTVSQFFEEAFEMLGILLFLYALLDHLRRNIGSISIGITARYSNRPASI